MKFFWKKKSKPFLQAQGKHTLSQALPWLAFWCKSNLICSDPSSIP